MNPISEKKQTDLSSWGGGGLIGLYGDFFQENKNLVELDFGFHGNGEN